MACDGTGTGASFNGPTDLAFVDPTFSELYVADQDIHRIRKVSVISGQVTTLAGSGAPASNDGFGTGASFSSPSGVVVDTSGNLVVADSGNNLMRKVTPAGVVTTLAGSGVSGNADGTSAAFKKPSYVAFWQGTTSIGPALYVSDENHRIRKLVCAPGTWASSSVTMCDFCAAGKFGKEAGVKTPSCNGDCIEGHFCLLGSTTATQFPCPAGRFGNASGLSDPTCTDFCSAGYYGTSGQGQVMASCQGQCSAGYFCPMGSISSQGSTNAAPAPNPCPAGKFGPPHGGHWEHLQRDANCDRQHLWRPHSWRGTVGYHPKRYSRGRKNSCSRSGIWLAVHGERAAVRACGHYTFHSGARFRRFLPQLRPWPLRGNYRAHN